MPLLRAGFSFTDVGRLAGADDVRVLGSVMAEVKRQDEIGRLLLKLDVAEAAHAALVGAYPGNKNLATYNRWRGRVERELAKLAGLSTTTVWDRVAMKSKRLGRR